MNLVTLSPGDKIADTILSITPAFALVLKANGFRGVLRYVTTVTSYELAAAFNAGLAVGFVTYGNDTNAVYQLSHLRALGTPPGHHLFLDVEGASKHWPDVPMQMQDERFWAKKVEAAGFIPARYAGADQQLTGHEQWVLPHRLYWHSCSNVVDRFGKQSVPDCGYAMFQDPKFNQMVGPGYVIDVDKVTTGDKQGRLPILVGA